MNLTRTNWPLGWTPCADDVNGDPSGLVRADNLTLDQKGVLSLTRGVQQIGGNFFDYVDRMYSKNMGGAEFLWLSCGPIGQFIYRGVSSFIEFAEGTNRTCFGDAIGNVLILAGRLRLKDKDGTSLPVALGLLTAGTPKVAGVSQTTKSLSGTITAILGTSIGSDDVTIYIQVDQTASQAVAVLGLGGPTNCLDLGDGAAGNPDNDIIQFTVTPDDSNTISGMSIDFLLGTTVVGDTKLHTPDFFTWQVDLTLLLQGVDQQTTLTPTRSQFTRVGSSAVGWDKVNAVRFTYKSTSFNSCDWGNVTLIGGLQGQVNGSYNYIQVNVNNNGQYQALSPCSTPSTLVTLVNGAVSLTPGAVDVQTTEIWYYRYGGTLDQYYRVGIGKLGQTFVDGTNDDDILTIDLPLNPFLLSVQPLSDGNGIAEDILCVAGLMYGRMLYMTQSFIYLSDFLDPDAIDSRYTLKASGDPSEINLWLKALTNNVMLLGTNKNLYEITGTLTALPDGTIDAAINPIGEQYPPITEDVCAGEATVFYMGADGIRATQGSNSIQLSTALRLLFEGSNQWGIAPVVINPYANYAMAAGHGRFYVSIPTTDGKTYLWIWDAINQYWRLMYTDPVSIYITLSGRVLLGYNLSTNTNLSGGLFQLDVGSGVTYNGGSEGWPFTLQTIFDANGQPRNRKDTFTLKIVANTGGAAVSVYLGKDGGSFVSIGQINSTIQETFYFNINSQTLGFRYALKLVDVNLVTEFFLYEATIEYDPRPEQNVYYRIQPNNLGSETRKRVVNFAFVIDTLGNSCTFTPIVDGVMGTPLIFNTPVKETVIYYFTFETIGTDFSGIITGGPFEFYGLNLEEITSEKMPVPCEFLVIPPNNYGVPNRKRHSSYKFQINTRGTPVTFVPILDGVSQASTVFNTSVKTTVEYFFTTDTIAIDIGGTLQSQTGAPFEFYGTVVPQTVEQLPDRLLYYKIPNSNLGSDSRKRFINYAFVIDTRGQNVSFYILVDDQNVTPFFGEVNTNGKQTFIFYFINETIGTDVGGYLVASGNIPFEFYNLNLEKCISEEMPTPTEYLLIPANDYGRPNRKRHSSYKFQINTRGQNVLFTPIVDGVEYQTATFNTSVKETVEYYFTNLDVIGIDIGGILECAEFGVEPFEFYGVITPQTIEWFPDLVKYYRIPNTNLGSDCRKRITTFAFVINTQGQPVTFQPYLDDNPSATPLTFTTQGKNTVIYYFTSETIITDVAGVLTGNAAFEFWGLNLEKIISEEMPSPCEYLVIQPNNYGTPNRKRHTSYKFVINTRGENVQFTPILDRVVYQPAIYNTSVKTTVEYFFPIAYGDVIGIDIGGILQAQTNTPFEFYGDITPQTVEKLPDQLTFYRIPNSNLGSDSRKRIIQYAFVIDTFGLPITFTPILDGVYFPTQQFITQGKTTVIYYFTSETIMTDIGGIVESIGLKPFEFYNLNLEKIVSEEMPVPCEFLVIPANDYGVPNRKRHSSYKFQINTRGGAVIFTPIIDGVSYSSKTYNTTTKRTVEYFFQSDTIGIDVGGTLDSSNSGIPFEFYGVIVPQTVEKLPDRLEFYRIPNSNLGSVSRKRIINYAFVIDTYGANVTFIPFLDGQPVNQLATQVNTNGKETFIFYFTTETICTDIGGSLGGNVFEFYGLNPEKIVSEDMPTPCQYLVIPANDYGVPNRKRHTSYKFQINTRGMNVLFTPILDGISYPGTTFNTPVKRTVEYFFPESDIIGIDVGGTLQSLSTTPFEFYGVITPQSVEKLPDRLEYLRITNTNFDIAARKRIRTLPIIIDTYGNNVTFTPIVDGVLGSATILNTIGKITTYYYFSSDSFGTDYGGILESVNIPPSPFEFYRMGTPETVETLPVPRTFDQLGPLRLDKIAKFFTLRVRLIGTGTTANMPYAIFGSNSTTVPVQQQEPLISGSFSITPYADEIYEILLPKTINTDVVRLTLGPIVDPFHRYEVLVRMTTSGMETNAKWVPMK